MLTRRTSLKKIPVVAYLLHHASVQSVPNCILFSKIVEAVKETSDEGLLGDIASGGGIGGVGTGELVDGEGAE